MAPFQTTVTIRQDNADNLDQDVIDVQILPDEEIWAENTTAITGNTSERSESIDGVDQWPSDEGTFKLTCSRYIGRTFATAIVTSAIFSPLIMIILPKLGLFPDTSTILTIEQKLLFSSCNIECKGHLLSLAFKITLLGIGNWAVFWKSREALMPRLCMFRTGVIVLTTLCICTYWLFYIVQITEGAKTTVIAEYKSLVNYANNLIDTLLFIHYVAVILIEIRQLNPTYYLKVVRSPDGVSRSYAIGQLSIQRAAICILEKYYTEFSIYNPYLERLPTSKYGKKQHSNNFKFYDVDNSVTNTVEQHNQHTGSGSDRAILAAQAQRRDSSHNERFYEEHEYERRVRKRKARLITAAEEAFAHIQRVNSDSRLVPNSTPLDPMEAAQSVFPSMARALQKYLRITRQQPRHSIESILERLARCLAQDATPRTFLEPFFNTTPVLSCEKERQRTSQHWALVCEGELPSRQLTSGCEFQLRQGEVALLCSVHQLPNLYLTEQVALPKSNRFLLKLNSETSM